MKLSRGANGSSTALDTVLFVILVGVAVVTLSATTPGGADAPRRVADETADVLATSTTEVSYERWGDVSPASGGGSVTVDREASGTYAELLAAVLLADPELGSESLTGGGNDLDDAVANATLRALPARDARVQVRAVWRPYPGSVLGRTVTMGESPPVDADLSVATVAVPAGVPNATHDYAAGAASYDRIAGMLARRIVLGLFPPRQMEDAMASEGPDRAVAASRYRAASETLGVEVGDPLRAGNVRTANRLLAETLEKRLARDLAEAFETPQAAARAVAVHRVRVVVRAWSP
ncbi:MAG: hypothetical protein V5A44_08770 [Haloarculaceae archaeon]